MRARIAQCVCVCVFFVLVGSELGASTCAQTRTRAKVNVRPRQLVNREKLRTKDMTPDCKTQLELHDMILYHVFDVHRIFHAQPVWHGQAHTQSFCVQGKEIFMKLSETFYTTVVKYFAMSLKTLVSFGHHARNSCPYDYTITEDTWHQFCSTLAPIIPLGDGVCGLTKIMLDMATRTTQRASGCALAHVKSPFRVVTRSRKTKNRLTCGPCCVRENTARSFFLKGSE